MKYPIFSIIFFITLPVTFIANWKSEKIKRLQQIKPISNIMQIDAMFDILVLYYVNNMSADRMTGFVCMILLPLCVILNGTIPNFKNNWYFLISLVTSLLMANFVDYSVIDNAMGYLLYPQLILQFLAIVVSSINSLKHKRGLQSVNYLYYLLLGFLILEFFWKLAYYQIATFEMGNFMKYHYFFIAYLTVYRLVYLAYVAVFLKSGLKNIRTGLQVDKYYDQGYRNRN